MPETRLRASDDPQQSSIGKGGKLIPTSAGRFADGAHGFHECGVMVGAYLPGGEEAAELSEAGAVRPSEQGTAHAALDGRQLMSPTWCCATGSCRAWIVETCRRIRAEPGNTMLPVVMVTALKSKEHRVSGIEAGADDFRSKPINVHELLARAR